VTDRSVLWQAIRRLDDAGIAVEEISLRSPSLDEVFLALTGHPAEEGEDEGTRRNSEGRRR